MNPRSHSGAHKRASELGFKIELFWIGNGGDSLSFKRLQSVLEARGVMGIMILPLNTAQDLTIFDFSNFSVVQMDHCLIEPHFNTILPDHYISMMNALQKLKKWNYEKIGLCMEDRRDRRIKNKWSAAFNSYMKHYSSHTNIEPLIQKEFDPKSFRKWFVKFRPDAIISDQEVLIEWLQADGIRVPDDVGFLRVNHSERKAPCAGLDLNPQRLGTTVIEALVSQIHRFEKGIPEYVKTTTIEATWVDGPTLLKR